MGKRYKSEKIYDESYFIHDTKTKKCLSIATVVRLLNKYDEKIKADALKNQNSKAIEVLEKVKMKTEWKFNSITEVVKYIDNQITELRGGENE